LALTGDLAAQVHHLGLFLHRANHPEAHELGAAHGAEVGAVWFRAGGDENALPERQRVTDVSFAAAIHNLWAAFIKDERSAAEEIEWPSYTELNPVVLQLSPDGFVARIDPFDARTALWTKQTGKADDNAA